MDVVVLINVNKYNALKKSDNFRHLHNFHGAFGGGRGFVGDGLCELLVRIHDNNHITL